MKKKYTIRFSLAILLGAVVIGWLAARHGWPLLVAVASSMLWGACGLAGILVRDREAMGSRWTPPVNRQTDAGDA